MSTTLEYLKEKEWSMGNGQCPECCGCHLRFFKGYCALKEANEIGHEKCCKLAESIEELGGEVVWKGEYELTEEDKAAWVKKEKLLRPVFDRMRKSVEEKLWNSPAFQDGAK